MFNHCFFVAYLSVWNVERLLVSSPFGAVLYYYPPIGGSNENEAIACNPFGASFPLLCLTAGTPVSFGR
jgi:hypothetical protein